MATYSFQADEPTIRRITAAFPADRFHNPPAYARSLIRLEGCSITIYDSGKVVFQGPQADHYAAGFRPEAAGFSAQAGSDEVGTGDYFGPVCVCACWIDQQVHDRLQGRVIVDSKQLTDDVIEQMAPELMTAVPHSLAVLMPEEYNRVTAANNMNRIKARMHNQCYVNLLAKGYHLPALVVIDQFCPPEAYYRYLDAQDTPVRGIHFETKAENKYESVGCAAIIARHAFITSMAKMAQAWGMPLPKGAGPAVDQAARAFVSRWGADRLPQVAKMNFKNTGRL